ncbi:MAG TPA: hypothetical protein VKV06_11025 [Acidimicrobiales bacterium]|nr:hypothetical protein [Acidimicrobiales bacterium]
MAPRAELSSIATGLDDLVERITQIVDGLSGSERDDLEADLYEVERMLNGARRRLQKLAG